MPMSSFRYLFLIIAFVLFILSAMGVSSRLNLQSLGLAFWVLFLIIPW